MRKKVLGRGFFICLLVALASAPLWLAEPAAAETLAKVRAAPDGVEWTPARKDTSLTLVVSGTGTRVERTYKPGQSPRFGVRDRKTGVRADGVYRWELRVAQKLDRPRKRQEGRIDAQGREVGRNKAKKVEGQLVQTGSFTILDGKLVNHAKEEEAAGRDPRREGGIEVEGDLTVEGKKMFRTADPDTGASIAYVALEGPEAGTYLRGSAQTADGEAVIELPGHFSSVTEPEGLTVQLTPLGTWARLYVAEATPGRLVVRDAESRDGVAFDFLVQGVRKGYSDHRVERPADADRE